MVCKLNLSVYYRRSVFSNITLESTIMIDDPKEKFSNVDSAKSAEQRRYRKSLLGKSLVWLQSGILVPLLSGTLQVLVGLMLVGISILGLLQPLWLSAVLSLVGSISSMMGVYLIYHEFSKQDTFDSLINKSIRRVIKAQN